MLKSEATQEILIVTGMSGAGRTTVANTLEDMGWYVVDNLPLRLLKTVADIAERSDGALPKIAAVIDSRSRELAANLRAAVADLAATAFVRVVFLDARDDVLVRRYESVRRPHPLMGDGSIIDGIREERHRASELRGLSDFIIDTTRFNVHELATHTRELFGAEGAPQLRLVVQSFGFKYGVPTDSDLMIDMRFLPNPFWDPEMRPLTGLDARVSDYVFSRPGACEFLDGFMAALQHVLAGYQRENKRHALLSVGCTGGKHRSVATAQRIAAHVAEIDDVQATLRHRDLGRE